MKSKVYTISILLCTFLFLTAFDLFDEQNVLMTENKLIDFGNNGGNGLYDDPGVVAPTTTPTPKPSPSPTPIPKKSENNFRVRIRSNRLYWGIATDEDNNSTEKLLDGFEELKTLISTKCISGSSLYIIDDYGEAETYKMVRDYASTSKRQYKLIFVPDYDENDSNETEDETSDDQ